MGRPRLIALIALGAVAAIWGGGLVIATIEQALPEPRQWLGHAAFHVWTSAIAAAVALGAVTTLRSMRDRPTVMRPLGLVVVPVAVLATVTGLLDAIGAYPTLRGFHDAVNAVARPALWLLTTLLVVVAAAAIASSMPAPKGPVGGGGTEVSR